MKIQAFHRFEAFLAQFRLLEEIQGFSLAVGAHREGGEAGVRNQRQGGDGTRSRGEQQQQAEPPRCAGAEDYAGKGNREQQRWPNSPSLPFARCLGFGARVRVRVHPKPYTKTQTFHRFEGFLARFCLLEVIRGFSLAIGAHREGGKREPGTRIREEMWALRSRYLDVKNLISDDRVDISIVDSDRFRSIITKVESQHEHDKSPSTIRSP